MSKLFFDSDIILDILLQRQPHFEASADLFKICGEEKHQCCASVHSILNVHYIAKKIHGEHNTRKSLQMLTKVIDVVEENNSHIQQALSSSFTDFEDAVQYYAAVSAKADFIITRNIKDYTHSAIPVLTAEQFLQTL
jgi:predicted nucleic acid-binding protein